jgi:FHS family glucose/mannose:H+ symporter-like MFS transporter
MFTPRGFCTGLACLFLAGLGMGQLMSSINLTVGRAHSAARAGALSNLAALWCVGAIASPLVTSVLFAAFPSPFRTSLMAVLFLLPLMEANIPASSSMSSAVEAPAAVRKPRRAARMGVLFMLFFFLYGGIEASITGWLPLYAIRAGAADLVAGQWTISLLWLGLAAGRLMTKFIVPRIGELRLLQLVLLLSALAFADLLVFHSGWAFTSGCVAAGFVLGPVFPLALSMTIGQALSNRAMGVVLASCALGSSLLPSALGLLSGLSHSLQRAMLLPLSGLLVLMFMVELAKPDRSEA